MGDARKLIEQLRDVFQDRVDGLERVSGEHLDRWAAQGSREWTARREAHERDRQARADARERQAQDERADRRARLLEEREEHEERERERRAAKRERHRARKRTHRHRRARRRGKRDDERDLDPEEIEHRRIVRRARRRANRRIGFLSHFVTYLSVLAIILVTSRNFRAVAITALAWGVGVFIHYLTSVAAPRLRDRWVEDEVGARSPKAVATERRRVETRSRRSMEDLSASIAHEIRNPITAAKSLVQQMGEDPSSNENLEYAEVALSELDRVERSISHLLRYARDEEPRFETIALESIARAAADGLRDRAREAGVEIHIDFDREGVIRGDPEKLRRVFENLISNALDAFAGQATAQPRLEILGGENLAGNEVWVRVVDNGPGIAPEDRARIWSPFHTTKETGTGLGLALSRKTVEAHGGRMELEERPAEGTEFVISFPKVLTEGDSRTEEPTQGGPDGGR